MSTNSTQNCPQCGAPLASDAPGGLCPRCLMSVNLATQTDFSDSGASHTAAATPPPSPEEIAQHFPNFEILECLGRGGMGVVYRARQKSLNRLVALKILAPERVKDDAFAKRFVIEAETLAKLSHPNIVTIHDFGQADGLFYLVMEFVDGVTLRQLLGASRISAREALAIVPQICDALQYAHDAGIVHRDIKPENILMDRLGRVKVADFGLAKLVGQASRLSQTSEAPAPQGGVPERLETGATPVPQASLTGAQVMGTPRYMSPEQAGQPGEVDHRADIFSLGVVLYEMLTGELPGKELQPPSRKVLVDVRLDEVVLRALEQKPELRYQQASEVKTRLETIASTPPGDSGILSGQTESRRHEGAGSRPTSATRFRWNFWGHFGAAFGASLWMPVTAIFSEWSGLGIALSDAAALVIMVTAFVIWGLRHRLSAFRGLMILLAASFVATTVFLAGADALGLTVRSAWPGGTQVSPSRYAWALAIFPVLAVWFLALERDGAAGSPRSPASNLDMETPPRRWLKVVMASVVLTYAVSVVGGFLLAMLSVPGSSRWLLMLFFLTTVGSPLLSSALLRHPDPNVPRRFRKACSIVGIFVAVPLIGFALFFIFALLSESGGWNPALDEAVIVPLIWLGAVLLPLCSWRLWRGTSPPGRGATDANPLPILDFWQALEAGDYALAWAKTAPYFQRDLSLDKWVFRMEELRRPLGKAVSRQTLSQVFTNPGRRFEQVVLTTFDTQQSATETVFCALQPDGEWRVEKYELGRPGPCEPSASQTPSAGTSLDWRQALGAVAWHAGLMLLLLALIGLVIPRFTAILAEMLDGQALPATTRVILGLGHAVRSGSLLLVVFIPLGLALDFGLCLLAQHLGGRRGQRLWTLAWGLGWLLALAVVALALFVPLRRLAAELASPSPVVTNQALTFGPTVESTLPLSDLGYSYSLNLESGEMQPMPAGMTMADWSTGIQLPDGIIIIAPTTNRALTIAGTGTRVIPLLNGAAAWDNPQPEHLDSLDSLASGKTESVTGESSSPPVTFAFRTVKGERGLLQVIGYVERPSGVTLRYKFLRSTTTPEPGTIQPGSDLRWQDHLRLKQGIGLGESGTGSHGDDALRYAIQFNPDTVALTLAWRTEPGWESRVQAESKLGGFVAWADRATTRNASGSGTNRIVEERVMLSRREFDRVTAFILQRRKGPPTR